LYREWDREKSTGGAGWETGGGRGAGRGECSGGSQREKLWAWSEGGWRGSEKRLGRRVLSGGRGGGGGANWAERGGRGARCFMPNEGGEGGGGKGEGKRWVKSGRGRALTHKRKVPGGEWGRGVGWGVERSTLGMRGTE